jgi:hypothetical protein
MQLHGVWDDNKIVNGTHTATVGPLLRKSLTGFDFQSRDTFHPSILFTN